MPRCAAEYCHNISKGIKMCIFPKDMELQMLWLKNMGKSYWQPKRDSRLCEVHFDEDQWENIKVDGTKKLKLKAVPTIFGEAARMRTEILKNNCFQQNKIPINNDTIEKELEGNNMEEEDDNEKNLQVNKDTTEQSLEVPQNNNIEGECESEKTDNNLALNHIKIISEYEQKLQKMNKLLLQNMESKKNMAIQMQKMKIKLKRLQHEVQTMKHFKVINKVSMSPFN